MQKIITAFIFLLFISCSQEQANTITIENAWIREAPPNATVMAGYLVIHNSTDNDRMITYAKSKQFNAVEMHRTVVKDGVAKMRRYEEIILPAGKSLEFKPGDFHLMLMSPKSVLKANDEVTVTLCLKDGDNIEEFDVVMPIKKP